MIKKRLLFCLLTGLTTVTWGQQNIPDSLVSLFSQQLEVFPQEKIYLHTDKSYYLAGERIWFRAHLVDASSHVPSPDSRYVYVELFNPLDSLITRVKICNDDDAYHGYIDIPRDIPEGRYLLRAYTHFMLNLDEDYFYTNTIDIGSPANLQLRVDAKFFVETDGKVNADFSFIHPDSSGTIVPRSVQASINGGEMQTLQVNAGGTTGFSFRLPANTSKRILLLEVKNSVDAYRQFFHIPATGDDFDVNFYPEGGYMLQGAGCRVAFKALTSDGQAADVKGVVYDHLGNELIQTRTAYNGMGSFTLYPEAGVSYYMVCTNDRQQTKRFELPIALKTGYMLSVNAIHRDNIYVSVLKSAPAERLYLLAHTRGMVHYAAQWNEAGNVIVLPKKQLPSGVLHLVLFDSGLNPVSERLVFVNNDDQAQVSFQNDREVYDARSLVNCNMMLTDDDGSPLTGSFSVSVTADHAVAVDTVTNILTQLLLTSDLRGHIENPAAYFRNDQISVAALDLLMLTQGWRRYDIAALTHGQLAYPAIPLELGAEITGRVRRLLVDSPLENAQVSVASSNGEYFDKTETDPFGHFTFKGSDQPDSVVFIVQAVRQSGDLNPELLIDEETFPERILPAEVQPEMKKQSLKEYAEQIAPYILSEKDIWTIDLSEVTVTAERLQPSQRKSVFYTSPSKSLTEAEIEKTSTGINDIKDLFTMHLGMLEIAGGLVLHATGGFPIWLVDEIPRDYSYIMQLSKFEIEQIDVLQSPGNTATFGMRGANGVIAIFTKRGKINNKEMPVFHVKTLLPLGYQRPAAFYKPKYDTPEKRNNQVSDMRTTIHWQPEVRTDTLGIASFDFYTADTESFYTVVMEGVAANGKIIRHEGKIQIQCPSLVLKD